MGRKQASVQRRNGSNSQHSFPCSPPQPADHDRVLQHGFPDPPPSQLTMTRCCSAGSWTCILRARPMPSCGMSPSPPISLDVSMITTRRARAPLRERETSRIAVVLPTPGLRGIQFVIKTAVCNSHVCDPRIKHTQMSATPKWVRYSEIPTGSAAAPSWDKLLSSPGSPAQEEDGGPGLHQVPHELCTAPDCTTNAAGQADHSAPPGTQHGG